MSLEIDVSSKKGDFMYNSFISAADSEILILFGKSGAGKSLTLQMVAGLSDPDSGHIVIGGEVVFDSKTLVNLPPQRRKVGYVVQNLALFPHMTLEGNVLFGATRDGKEGRSRAREMIRDLGLHGLEKRMPSTLSGGQAQRAALARALAKGAKILLLDEPFSALDNELKQELRNILFRVRDETGVTVLMVTHDLREAHFLADKLAIMDNGVILNSGTPRDVFDRPKSVKEALLTGFANLLKASVLERSREKVTVSMLGGVYDCGSWTGYIQDYQPGGKVYVVSRAENVYLIRRNIEDNSRNICTGVITQRVSYGSSYILDIKTKSGNVLQSEINARPYQTLGVEDRDEWKIEMSSAALHVIKTDDT